MEKCRILTNNIKVKKIIETIEGAPKRYLKKNEICFPHNDRIIIVTKGKIKITIYNDNKEITLYYLTKNNIAFCSEENIIKAKEESEFYFIPINKLEKFIENTYLCNTLLKIILENIKIERNLIKDLAFKSCSQRAIEFLYSVTNDIGKKTPDGIKIELNCSINEFATFLGTSRQTLSTFLNILIKNNILEKRKKAFLIKDLEALKNFKL